MSPRHLFPMCISLSLLSSKHLSSRLLPLSNISIDPLSPSYISPSHLSHRYLSPRCLSLSQICDPVIYHPFMRKVDDGEKKREKKIMTFIVATNVIASRTPERRLTGRSINLFREQNLVMSYKSASWAIASLETLSFQTTCASPDQPLHPRQSHNISKGRLKKKMSDSLVTKLLGRGFRGFLEVFYLFSFQPQNICSKFLNFSS